MTTETTTCWECKGTGEITDLTERGWMSLLCQCCGGEGILDVADDMDGEDPVEGTADYERAWEIQARAA